MKKTTNLWTKEEIKILIEKGKDLSKYELAQLIKNPTPISISVKCSRLGIYKSKAYLSEQAKNARNSIINPYRILNLDLSFDDLNSEVQQIILGSILGDGFIAKNGIKSKEYCFRESHCTAQIDYLNWKFRILIQLKPKLSEGELFTPTHLIFTKLKKSFYTKGKRKNNLINEYTKKLDWLGFFVWYLDDGGLQSRRRDFTITSKLFDKEGIIRLINIINKKLDLNLIIKFYKHKEGIMARIKVLARDRKNVQKNFKILFEKYKLPQHMFYKINLQPLKNNRKNG